MFSVFEFRLLNFSYFKAHFSGHTVSLSTQHSSVYWFDIYFYSNLKKKLNPVHNKNITFLFCTNHFIKWFAFVFIINDTKSKTQTFIKDNN